ncbi:MAG: tetratricopeptide repeat protein, partial [Cyanobacteria bacterium J06592_8]
GVASSLNNLGNAYRRLGQYQEAIEYYQQSLTIAREIGDRNGEAASLGNLGIAYRRLGQYEKAIEYYQQSLAIFQEIGDRKGVASSLNNLGNAYFSLGQYQKAIEYHQQSLAIDREIGDRKGVASSLNNLGNAYDSLGQYQEAIEYHQQSLAIEREIGDRNGVASSLGNLGNAYLSLGQYQKAIEYHQQQLTIAREIGDRNGVASSLNNLGNAYRRLGQYQEAIEYYQQSLTIAREIGDRNGEAASLGNLGIAYRRLGQYEKAIEYYQQSLAIFQEIGDRNGVASSLGNLGNAYLSLGQYQKAIEYHQQQLTIAREIGDRNGVASSLNNLGAAYDSLGQYQEAIEYHQQSLAIKREIGDRNGVANSLNNLGNAYLSLGQYQEAIEFYQQSLAIFQEIGDRKGVASSLGNLGIAYSRLGQYQEAIEYYQQSLAIDQEIGDREGEGVSLSNIGFLLDEQNQPELAIAFFKKSVNVREGIRQDIRGLSTDLQQSYTETVAGTYRRLADLLLSQGRILEAQQVLELLKIQEIRDYLDDQRAGGKLPGVTLLPKEEELLQRYDTLIAFAQTLLACEQTQCAELSQLRDERDTLKRQYQQAVQTLEAEIRSRRATEEDAFLDPDDLSKQAKDILQAQPGTVLIYPLVLEDKLWLLWAVEGRVVSKREIDVGQQQLGEAVLKLRQLLQDRSSDIEELQKVSKQLYDWLIAPVEAELQDAEHLVFSLDRVTRYIPMGVLFDGKQYLIQKYTVNTILSAELTDMRDRLPSGVENAPILALGVSYAVADFNSLPNVVTELDGIVREENNSEDSQGVYPGLQFLNGEFNFNALRDNLSGRKLLHIATHGKFVPGRREESYLMLGNGEKLPIPEIEVLTDYMDDTHLVVLSACETALGEADQEGIEINGISYYFLNGGAKTVLASLWNVNDGSTSHLMQQFYSHLSQGNFTKAEALQKAQLQMLRGEVVRVEGEGDRSVIKLVPKEGSSGSASTGLSHPYYWSAFILIGNGL